MEMMHHDGGVFNVVIGGQPSYGPMQAPSGSRGARFYDLSELDADIENAIAIYGDEPSGLPNRTDIDYYVYDGGISLRAQIRKNETVPLAMQFEAADCRIFLTPDTFNNFTNLWSYAADAIWTSPQLCVQGSTGYATPGNASSTSAHAPPEASPPAAVNYTGIGVPYLNTSDDQIPFLVYDGPIPDILPGEFAVLRSSSLQTSEFTELSPVQRLGPQVQRAPLPPPAPPRTITHGNLNNRKVCSSAAPPCNLRRKRRSLPYK